MATNTKSLSRSCSLLNEVNYCRMETTAALVWLGLLSHLEMDLLSLGGLVGVGDGEVDWLSHSLLSGPLGEGGLDSLGGLLDVGVFETGP